MQAHDWNDLRHFLALFRSRKLKDAGISVGTSETTVARRIKAFEEKIGTTLFLQSGVGRYEPTDAALQILAHAEAVEFENTALLEKLGKITDTVTGSVRVTSVPILINRFLVPHLHILTSKYPQLTVDLVPASQNLDLTKREADVAVRFARPTAGGLSIKAQKIGEMSFGAYKSKSVQEQVPKSFGWIRYDDEHSSLPQANWLETMYNSHAHSASGLRVADVETALEAVAHGMGKTLLPRLIADADPRICAIPTDVGTRKLPVRDVWLLSHVDQSARMSIASVKEWLVQLPWSIDHVS